MKKKLLSLVLASFALVSVAQARFYFGVEGGYSAHTTYGTSLKKNSLYFAAPSTDTIANALENGQKGYSVAGVFGTESFFLGGFLGSRSGTSIGYTSLEGYGSKMEFVDVGLSTDLILNLVVTRGFGLGVFGGIETGYHYILNEKLADLMSNHILDFVGRVGLTTLIADHHRLEFIAKLPVASVNFAGDEAYLGGFAGFARTSFMASYKFVF